MAEKAKLQVESLGLEENGLGLGEELSPSEGRPDPPPLVLLGVLFSVYLTFLSSPQHYSFSQELYLHTKEMDRLPHQDDKQKGTNWQSWAWQHKCTSRQI